MRSTTTEGAEEESGSEVVSGRAKSAPRTADANLLGADVHAEGEGRRSTRTGSVLSMCMVSPKDTTVLTPTNSQMLGKPVVCVGKLGGGRVVGAMGLGGVVVMSKGASKNSLQIMGAGGSHFRPVQERMAPSGLMKHVWQPSEASLHLGGLVPEEVVVVGLGVVVVVLGGAVVVIVVGHMQAYPP